VEETFLKCARQILTSIESGDINPDKIGSGIQFGDLSLRQLQRNSGNGSSSINDKEKVNSSKCAYGQCNI